MPEQVTIREVYALVEGKHAETIAHVDKVYTQLQAYVETHDSTHTSERRERASLIRWAVTTIISVIGFSSAIVIPLVRG